MREPEELIREVKTNFQIKIKLVVCFNLIITNVNTKNEWPKHSAFERVVREEDIKEVEPALLIGASGAFIDNENTKGEWDVIHVGQLFVP